MAGHSKWANIQHRKGRQDEKRGKVWTRLIREVIVAARQGGGVLSMNPRLRLAVEEIRYEGYGIGGAAIIVDAMTDNRVRTVAEIRHAFSKHGGNLGAEGSVAFQFKHCGQIVFAPGADEQVLLEAFARHEVTMRPENSVPLAGEDAERMHKLLDVIEDLDDTQAVFHNAEMPA